MITTVVWRCFLVSAVISILGAPLTMTLSVGSNEEVIDISSITEEEIEEATPEELEVLIEEKGSYRRVSGFERFSYVAGHPQFWHFYRRVVVSIFCLVLPATVIASLWTVRAIRRSPSTKSGT